MVSDDSLEMEAAGEVDNWSRVFELDMSGGCAMENGRSDVVSKWLWGILNSSGGSHGSKGEERGSPMHVLEWKRLGWAISTFERRAMKVSDLKCVRQISIYLLTFDTNLGDNNFSRPTTVQYTERT